MAPMPRAGNDTAAPYLSGHPMANNSNTAAMPTRSMTAPESLATATATASRTGAAMPSAPAYTGAASANEVSVLWGWTFVGMLGLVM